MDVKQEIEEAFKTFEQNIHTTDAKAYRSTTVDDVYQAARIIERDQAQRKCLRNLRRIEPLLNSLRKFGVAIDVLCQGTPYLPFLWVRRLSEQMIRNTHTSRPPSNSSSMYVPATSMQTSGEMLLAWNVTSRAIPLSYGHVNTILHEVLDFVLCQC